MRRPMKITLYVMAVYLLVVGAVFLFLPDVARAVFQAPLPDATLNMLYGAETMAMAGLAYVVARDEGKLNGSLGVILFGNVIHAVLMGYAMATGMMSFAQVGPPFVISTVFSLLLIFLR